MALLLIEDNAGDVRLLREMLKEQRSANIELTHVTCMEDAERHLALRSADIILLDLGLPDTQGRESVRRARAAALRTPLVVLTGRDDASFAALALQDGAQDYLIKGQIESRALVRALRYAVERKAMEEALFAERERAQVTLNSIGDAVVCTDVLGNITFLNVVAEVLTGWTLGEAAGHPMAEVFRVIDSASRGAMRLPITPEPSNGVTDLPSTCDLVRRDGVEMPIEVSIAPINDRGGQQSGAVIVFRDVTKVRAATREMAHSAQHDFLTGLPNRMLLNDRINQAIGLAGRAEKKVAVLFLDLDGFKRVNDSLGHSVGDKLLQSVAARLVGCVRGSDTVSRQGGDEFIVLLSEVQHYDDASIIARRILRVIGDDHNVDCTDLRVTTSVGVSVFPDDGGDAETLIKNADTAMYQAKENGPQRHRFFTSEMNGRAAERQAIEEGLRRALERGEFALAYQPKVDLATGAISGAEALVRWVHPVRGLLPAAEFVTVAEECGLLVPIGRWVLRQACAQIRSWIDAGLAVPAVSINVSGLEIRDEAFVASVIATLDDAGIAAELLELELTEGVLTTRVEATAATIRALREAGVQVALDNFGTGYSSLSYLRRHPVDTLKIDQSFVRQIGTLGGDTTVVTAIIGMARNLGLRVVAEGVGSIEELTFLTARQCDQGQGYFFSRPLPAEDFGQMLAEDSRHQALSRLGVRPRVSRISA
jgi:diguanylate cyclase (GGDEF)-like protein/PAS domain S-box-containing protein